MWFRLAESVSFFDVQKDSFGMYVCQRQHHCFDLPTKVIKIQVVKKNKLPPSNNGPSYNSTIL